mgnify:CR=1 FL=1
MKRARYEYKEQAKQLLTGKYQNVIIIMLIMGVVSSLFISGNFSQNANFGARLLSIISFALSAAFTYAQTKMYIGVTNDENPVIETVVLAGFKENYVRSLITLLIQTVYIILWTLLFVIPGIIKAYAYSMSFYLLNKNKDLQPSEAITMSKEYTNGYKMDLFMLHLSYIGWYILSLFTFGILLFWVIPKVQTAQTLIFNEIYLEKNPAVNQPVGDLPE